MASTSGAAPGRGSRLDRGDGRVTVAVASRDRRAVLLRSLPRHLELPEAPPVVVVDNASTDGTPAAVAEAYPAVTLVQLESNRGGAGRNVGAGRARTPYVAFSDDDSWWEPGALAHAADLLDAHPRLALVAARILVGPERRLDPTCAEMARSPLPSAADVPGRAVLGFVACGAIVRRSAFLAVGGFSERLVFIGEEQLLAVDLAARGWVSSYVEDVVAYHDPPPGLDADGRARLATRNDLWFAWLRLAAAAAVQTSLALARSSLAHPARRAGVAEALRDLPGVLRERRPAPAPVRRAHARVYGGKAPPRRRRPRTGAP